MYSVHQKGGEDGHVGSERSVYISMNHDYSPEVTRNGEIKRTFKVLRRLRDDENLALCLVEEWQHSTVIKRSTGLYFSEWVTYRPPAPPHLDAPHRVEVEQVTDAAPIRDESDFPVRLIDIQATLDSHGGVCFIQPTDWSFHILSHTWSLAVRDFSVSIGKTVTSAEDYNKAFQEAKLNELPGEAGACYHSLLAFLRLLKEEEVRVIWFDALCINQTDKEEKNREICRMGAYYGCSLGCYVLAHGIGRGFKLWDEIQCCSLHAPRSCVPRWFERVWTLQEFLLPRKLTFLVEGLAKKTIGLVNHFIRRAGVDGLCICALPVRDYTFRVHLSEIDGGEEDEIIHNQGKQTGACDRCRWFQLVRKSDEQAGLYFVDREAYCFLCELDKRPCEDFLELLVKNDTMLWNLFALANHHCPAQTFKLVEMLRKRKCTNAEDRVLGVLGLLRRGRPGQLQLRSGKTLTEQIMNLHHYCDVRTFFRLCLMEPMAFQTVGMSWAPCLELADHYNPVELGEWPRSEIFRPTARILSVSQRGLRLETQVAYARVCPRGQAIACIPIRGRLPELHLKVLQSKSESFIPPAWKHLHTHMQEDDYLCYSCILHGINDNCTHWIRDCELQVGEICTYPLKAHARERCGVKRHLKCTIHRHMVVQDPWIGNSVGKKAYAQFVMSFGAFSIHALKPFPLWLVLLGETDECMMGMMCIAKSDTGSELHKIGVFACPKPNFPSDPLFFRGVPYQQWLIGGFSYVSHKS